MKKHGVRRAFQGMSNSELRDYLSVQLVIMQSVRMAALTFKGDLFKAAVLFAEHNVSVATEAVYSRGLSIDLCHQVVNDAFLNGAPDLSPEVVDEDSDSSLSESQENPSKEPAPFEGLYESIQANPPKAIWNASRDTRLDTKESTGAET